MGTYTVSGDHPRTQHDPENWMRKAIQDLPRAFSLGMQVHREDSHGVERFAANRGRYQKAHPWDASS